MMETARSCVELAQQLHAVEAAIRNAKRIMIQEHMETSLESMAGFNEIDPPVLGELKSLSKYL